MIYLQQDGEEGEEETKFDPGYEPDWAVISTVKQNREKEQIPITETGRNSHSLTHSLQSSALLCCKHR